MGYMDFIGKKLANNISKSLVKWYRSVKFKDMFPSNMEIYIASRKQCFES